MRFKTSIKNISVLTKLTSCLNSIGKLAWLRLDEDEVRFTLMPEQGVQVFATLAQDTVFTDYRISSATSNIINLELPLSLFLRALRSCATASDATLRLTKRSSDNAPILSLTITTTTTTNALTSGSTLVTQEIPVRVLSAAAVAEIREPMCPEPDVHVVLPQIAHVRAVTERLNKLSAKPVRGGGDVDGGGGARLVLRANGRGVFKMGLEGNDAVRVETCWRELKNPGMSAGEGEGEGEGAGAGGRSQEEFVRVTVDGREWGRVLKVGGLARKVVACFIEDHALILYVYLTENEDDTTAVLTYYMSSYSS